MRLPVLLVLAAVVCAQPQRLRVGEIDFYGYADLDLDAIRASLPVHRGDELTEEEMPKLIERLKQDTKATNVAPVCCDGQGGLLIYIGLPGRSVRSVAHNPAPGGTVAFPRNITDLYQRFVDALMKAVEKGAGGEDDSRGYALFLDPAVRAEQLLLRDYTLRHESLVRRILAGSSDTGQRAIAAALMGYARESPAQISALVRAARDSGDDVRNNAIRALAVLARSSPKTARQIPASEFVDMLYSNSWTDRNKATFLLEGLTTARDAKVLEQVCSPAKEALLEMARWHAAGHAFAARMLLGRCAGIDEKRLQELARAGNLEPILKAFRNR